jgi:flagellar hook assembly protein FlgD
VRISYRLAAPASVRLLVCSGQGRVVRRLGEMRAGSGPAVTFWDGCGASGEPVSNGVYLVVLQTGTAERVCAVQYIR